MRTLRQHARILDVPADLDERVRVAVFPAALVMIAVRLSQRFEGASYHGATNRVNPALEGQGAVFVGAHLQVALLRRAALFRSESLGVSAVAHVVAERPEPSHAAFPRFLGQTVAPEPRSR